MNLLCTYDPLNENTVPSWLDSSTDKAASRKSEDVESNPTQVNSIVRVIFGSVD